MSQLPQELLDIVVDNLHDDTRSLKSCALAARAFLTSARIHIFRRIEIIPPKLKTNSSSSPCQKLLGLLTSSPHLPRLVEELCVVLMGSNFTDSSELQNIHKGPMPWITADDSLPLVLPPPQSQAHIPNRKRPTCLGNLAILGERTPAPENCSNSYILLPDTRVCPPARNRRQVSRAAVVALPRRSGSQRALALACVVHLAAAGAHRESLASRGFGITPMAATAAHPSRLRPALWAPLRISQCTGDRLGPCQCAHGSNISITIAEHHNAGRERGRASASFVSSFASSRWLPLIQFQLPSPALDPYIRHLALAVRSYIFLLLSVLSPIAPRGDCIRRPRRAGGH
ncbi:hypothetical protein MSAN_00947200 [Mycena sanguinolenta]|uniref:F-box domain-containing protein n=1 Tax=Mycena sanguinolenta TaxID=230812 RepID=A0A8H6YTH7_9AGAR|nr:hypothetical protein MSAN_00947200 [Mycena sanguinolenta]